MTYTGQEALERANSLTKLKVDLTNWCIYYQDPETSEHWILRFPEGSNVNGGAPVLELNPEAAASAAEE